MVPYDGIDLGQYWLETKPLPKSMLTSDHDDIIKWKHFLQYWPFVLGIHRSPVNFPHKDQWHGALMFSLICALINGGVNNGGAGNLRGLCNPLWLHCSVSEILQHLPKSKFAAIIQVTILNKFLICSFKVSATSYRGHWVNIILQVLILMWSATCLLVDVANVV